MKLKNRKFEFKMKSKSEGETYKGVDVVKISGYGAVYGNVDSYNDVIEHGAFKDAMASKTKLLKGHFGPTAGTITKLKEDEKGLYMEAVIPKSDKITADLIKINAINSMSVGFFVKKSEYDKDAGILYIKKGKLIEISLVQFPANPKAKITDIKNNNNMSKQEQKDAKVKIKELKAKLKETERKLEALETKNEDSKEKDLFTAEVEKLKADLKSKADALAKLKSEAKKKAKDAKQKDVEEEIKAERRKRKDAENKLKEFIQKNIKSDETFEDFILKNKDDLFAGKKIKIKSTTLIDDKGLGKEAGWFGGIRSAYPVDFLFDKREVGSDMTIKWPEVAYVNGDIVTEEGASIKGDATQTISSKTRQVGKLGHYMKYSIELENDTRGFLGELRAELVRNVVDGFQEKLINGTGADTSGNEKKLFGVNSIAVAWTKDSNNIDPNATFATVIDHGIIQINKGAGQQPTAILVNPDTYGRILSIVNSKGHRLFGATIGAAQDGTVYLSNIPVYKSKGVATGNFLMGNFSAARLYESDYVLQITQVNDDALKGLKTAVLHKYGQVVVKTADKNAFVKGAIAASITAAKS